MITSVVVRKTKMVRRAFRAAHEGSPRLARCRSSTGRPAQASDQSWHARLRLWVRMDASTIRFVRGARSNASPSTNRQTVALHTPRCSATSLTRSSRYRPPQYDTSSAVVGVVATRGAVPDATWPVRLLLATDQAANGHRSAPPRRSRAAARAPDRWLSRIS
jgi:hypothetical protein